MLQEGNEFEVVVKQKDNVIDCVTVAFPPSSMIVINDIGVVTLLRKD